jgi:frataxin-like iron-binding protein CyaY
MEKKMKCITFDKAAQDALPEAVKAKMKADREQAQKEKKSKTWYSWFPKNGDCPDIFNSIGEAAKDAQYKYNNGYEPYEDGDEYTSSIIYVGPVRFFDMETAVKSIVEDIEDAISEQVHDFSSGCDFESECKILKSDKEIFIKEATQALLPIVEKYVYINPLWVCSPTKKYDLKNKKWIEL